MNYFFVTIQYYYNNKNIIFSTVFKSTDYLTKEEIVETVFLKEAINHSHLGFHGLCKVAHDPNTNIISYSSLTKEQYKKYKNKKSK